jgi:predicted RNA-binding protein with PUA-like domain
MNYWLMKSEPECFGIADLKMRSKQTEPWDGVRNYQARNMMRDEMKVGDLAFFYHSNCKIPGIIGITKIVKSAYPDHTQFDPENHHYDPKSNLENPRWVMVDVKFEKQFKTVISLDSLRENPKLVEMPLLRKGNRLSITPVSKHQWEAILKMASLD